MASAYLTKNFFISLCVGDLAPLFAVEFTTTRFWPQSAPPLEKERDVVIEALIANFAHPIGLHRRGRGPLSLPTITQYMPVRLSLPISQSAAQSIGNALQLEILANGGCG